MNIYTESIATFYYLNVLFCIVFAKYYGLNKSLKNDTNINVPLWRKIGHNCKCLLIILFNMGNEILYLLFNAYDFLTIS
jgi:hypothetical protein